MTMPKYPKVEVCWEDAKSNDAWVLGNDIDESLARIITIGFLVIDTSALLVIARDFDEELGQLSGLIKIPKSCVLTCEELELRHLRS